MNPELAKAAMEQMSKMSPEQVAAMQQQAANMSPEMMQAAMAQMNGMSADDVARMRTQMSGMSADEMANASKQGMANFSAQQKYHLAGANTLKADGNTLLKQGKYGAAAEKYERARTNLSGMTDPESSTLVKACTLNLALCRLNLKQYASCIEACNSVLQTDADNVKALYRRGQAYAGNHQHGAAIKDYERAVTLSSNDPAQASLIKGKLEESRTAESSGITIEEIPEEAPPSAAGAGPSGPVIEEIDPNAPPPEPMEATTSAPEQARKQAAAAPGPGSAGVGAGMDPKLMSAAAASMSQEQLDAIAQMQGQPKGSITPEMLQTASKMMEGMDPEQLRQMQDIALKMRGFGGDTGASGAAQASSAGTGGAAGPGTSAPAMPPMGADGMPDMSAMMNDPKMMEQAMEMMKNMDEETLTSMIKGSTPGMSEEQASGMAKQMKDMSPGQMKMMMTAANVVQKGAKVAQKAKAALLSREAMACAVLLLLVGVALRYYGIM